MTPLKLTLKGFIGIRSGLGRNEVSIDLESVPGDLVALVGPNGAGKSTILDNLHPYRIMPSRASSYAVGSFSYYDQTYGDALKELRWQHEGQVYQSSIVIKGSNKTKKQECYLHRVVGEKLEPVTLPDGTVSDGKTDTYDRCVEHILGSPEMYFTAAFACQGRKTLADYPAGDVKAMLSDLLGLDHYQQLAAKANDVAKQLTTHKSALAERVGRVPILEQQRKRLESELEGAKDTVGMLELARTNAKTTAGVLSRKLAEAQAASAEAAQVERRRETLKQQLKALMQRAEAEDDQIRIRHQAVTDGLKRELAAHRANSDRFVADISRSNATIRDAQAKVDRAKGAEYALARLQAIDETELPTARAALEELEEEAKRCVQAKMDAQAARQSLDAVKKTGPATKAACESLRTRAGLIAEVPCQGTDLQGRCKLLAEANTAAAALPAEEAKLETLRKERDELVVRVDATTKALEAFDGLEARLAEAKGKVFELENERRSQATVAAYAEAAKEAAAAIYEATQHAAAVEADLARSREAEQEVTAKLAVEAESLQTDLATHEAAYIAERTVLDVEITSLPPTDTAALAKAQAELDKAEAALDAVGKQLDEANAAVAALKAQITGIGAELSTLDLDVQRAAKLDGEIAHFTLLTKALGRDGIIALCIDDAGPTLSSIANDLLTACYGPRFTVSIQTQEETKAGTMKETFDIRVFDAEREDVKSIGSVSGGERIWINEAMTRAIALYQAQNSGRSYGCLFSDESDGALDPEKKRQFLAMKRKVLELGGYGREFFISHTPAVVAEADGLIDLSSYRKE